MTVRSYYRALRRDGYRILPICPDARLDLLVTPPAHKELASIYADLGLNREPGAHLAELFRQTWSAIPRDAREVMLTRRLDTAMSRLHIELTDLEHEDVLGICRPFGVAVEFTYTLEASYSAPVVKGVIAHELAHVYRHVTGIHDEFNSRWFATREGPSTSELELKQLDAALEAETNRLAREWGFVRGNEEQPECLWPDWE